MSTIVKEEKALNILDEILKERIRVRLEDKANKIITEAQNRLKKEIKDTSDEICREVLVEFKNDSVLFADVMRMEKDLIIRAYYNNQEIKDEV